MNKLLLTAAMLLGAGTAVASNHMPNQTVARPLSIVADTADPYAGLTRTSLSDAVAKVEEATGGRVLEIRWLHAPGHGFETVIAKPDGVEYIRVNPLTDKLVVLRAEEIPEWMLPWKLRQDVRSLAQAKVPLTAAIQTAENATRAIAVDAGLAKPLTGGNSVLAYQIEVLRGGKPDRVAVDAVTGEMIANPDAVLDPWTPEKVLEKTVQQRDD
ncbi:MAG: hypothetical protein JWM77_843 [Rhodospirillales bacterium]|jgi:hypothetical protein|nr:hypothetical protein [Rhodospirillales bacterium]